jgi:hypothetical protein
MAYTAIPSTTKVPATITDVPSSITDVPSATVTDVPAKHSVGTSHLLDGSGNILAVTVGVDQLTNA